MLLGLRAQPREDTGLSQAEAVFGAPIVLNLCKMKKCQLMLLLKIFQKLCMFLLFLCPGAILAPSCRTSCQATSPPPCLGPSGRRHPTPSAALRRPLHRLTPRALLLHHPSRVLGRGHRHQLPQGLHGHGRHAWQPASHPGGLAATKRVSFSDPLVSTPSFPVLPRDGPGTVFLPGEEVFARPGLAVPSQVPQTRYPSRQRAPPKRLDL